MARLGEECGFHSAMIADHVVFPVASRSRYPYTVSGEHPSDGDALEQLRTLPDESVQCCVTSPPYWGLRDYGVDGQIGLLVEIMSRTTGEDEPQVSPIVGAATLHDIADVIRQVKIADPVLRYALSLVRTSRPKSPQAPESVKKWVQYGGSVRAAQYLVLGAKARALTSGRYHVTFDDVRAVAHPVLRHRVLVNFRAESEGVSTDQIIDELLERVAVPASGMK